MNARTRSFIAWLDLLRRLRPALSERERLLVAWEWSR